jgi:hypothetical protein
MSEETMLMLTVAAKRFVRAFVAGAVAQLAVILQATNVDTILNDPRAWLTAAVFGCMTGGILAAEKILRWKE